MPNEYTDLINEQRKAALQSSLFAGVRSQPDQEAKVQKLAGSVGLPLDAVRENMDQVVVTQRLADFDYDGMLKNSPKLAAWMSDASNSSVAHDDAKSLGALETAFRTLKDYSGAVAGGVVGDAIGRTFSGASELLDVGARAIDRPVRAVFGDKVADAFWYEPASIGGVKLDPFASLKSTGQSLKTLGDWMKPPTERQNLGTDVAGGIGQIGGQIATFLLTGGAATVGTMFAQGADVMAEKTAKDVADPALKDTAILAGGAITALTEKWGLDKILNRVPPKIKERTLRFLTDKLMAGGAEAAQEAFEGLLHDVARKTLTNSDAEVLDGVGREMSAAGLSAMIVRTALGVRGHARAKEQEDRFRAIVDSAQDSSLLKRYPEKFQQYVESLTAGGPIENIFIPADQFKEYFQSVDIDPAVFASQLGVQNYAEALVGGGDVVIPTASFLTNLVSTDHLQALSQDIRFNQADLTARERQIAEENREQKPSDETLARIIGADADVGSRPGFNEVRDSFIGELTGRFPLDQAEARATGYASAITTMAERMGVSPMELHQRFDLTVNSPLPDGLKTLADRVDVDIDPLLDRIRSGDLPQDALAFGASLVDFVRDAGGLRDSGEARDLDQSGARKPGQRKLVQPSGMSADAALQAAAEAGYFPGVDVSELTEADFLNALADDLGGNHRYSALNENNAAANDLRMLREMADWLDSIGADVQSMTNKQVRDVISRASKAAVGDVYEQAEITRDDVRNFEASLIAKYEGLKLDIYGGANGKPLTISRIEVAKRSGGTGSRVMQELMDFADAHGVTVALTPSKDFGGTVSRLKSFYGRFDFIENKGKNKDYEISETMYRLPKGERIYNQSAPQTETEAFKNWFGDSKVVDADGNPLVMYHGTAADFDTFDNKKTGANDRGLWGRGHYFAAVVAGANSYAERQGDGARVMPVYVSIKNPLILTTGSDFITRLPDGRNSRELIGPNLDGAKIKEIALSGGHDGVIQIRPNGLIGDVVAYQPDQIKSAIGNSGAFDPANPSILYQDKNQGARGSINVMPDGRMQINLFEKADASTLFHELGHFYLEVLGELSTDPNAPQQMRDDFQTIRNWMGLKDGEGIQVEHHEMFARAHEAYIMEGNTPSPEMRGIFVRFSSWMKQVYRSLVELRVPMSDEVRGVFDRIYATDEQIEAAKDEGLYTAALTTAEMVGMTEAEHAAYLRSVENAVENGRDRLRVKLMKEMKREQETQWKANRKAMKDAVTTEVDEQPVYVALQALSSGETADGLAVKLDKSELQRLYGKEFLKKLPKSGGKAIYNTKDDSSVDLDTAAEVLGFDSGRTMIDQLVNMQPRSALIEKITDERMVEQYGDTRFDGSIGEAAERALHNSSREDMLKIELRAIRKKAAEVGRINRDIAAGERQVQLAGEQMVRESLPQVERIGRTKEGREFTFMAFDPEPMKRAAAGLIGQKQYRDVQPQSYLIAERKAAKATAKAMKEGDYILAAEQKQRELFNHYLYKESTRAKEKADKQVDYINSRNNKRVRSLLGRAGADYLEQQDEIMERYEFKTVPITKLDRRQSLQAFVNQQEAEGKAVSIPEEVLNEARRVNWKQIPLDELGAVYDSIKNINHLANWKDSLIVKGKRREFKEMKAELLASIEESGLRSTGDIEAQNKHERTMVQKGAAAWRWYDAAHIKVEQLVEWLDGGDISGPWARNFFDLADEAQTKEYDLHRMVTMSINDLRNEMPKGWKDSLWEQVGFDLPVISANGVKSTKPTRYTMLSIALNMGNEQNMQRLRDGNQISDVQMQQIRESMTDADWKFVQGVWDSIEQLWPDMAALEKRSSGLEPVKVDAQSFTVRGQSYRGGYFPLVYDRRASRIGEKQIEANQTVENFLSVGVGRPTTNKGATKERSESVGAPLLLDMNDVLSGHISKVVKDISHREAVFGIHKILSDKEIKDALIDRLGLDYYDQLRNWSQVLVNDRSDSMNAAVGAARWMMTARTNLAIVTMGLKFSTALSQFAGFGPSADLVSPKYLAKALVQVANSPIQSWAFIAEKSGEMRNRVQTLDRDVRDSLRRIADKDTLISDVQRTAFFMTAYADRIVTMPTWMGAYNQAMGEGRTEEDAVRAGDRAVRLSQGGGGAKDLAAIQRNNELMKLLTMFYTPFSALYARLRDIGHQTAVQGIGYLPEAVARTVGLVILPALLGQMLAGRGPDEDEDKVWWSIRQMMLYPISALPVIRDFSGLVEQQVIKASGEGSMDYMPSYNLSPITSAIAKAWKNLVANPLAVAQGDKSMDGDVAWGAFESAGLIVGLPTAQARITGSYLADLMTGDADPENALELVRDLIYKRKKE